MHHCEWLVCPLGDLLIGIIMFTGDPPQSPPFPKLKKPVPSASPFRSGSPGLWASQRPLLNLLQSTALFPVQGRKAKLQGFRCGVLSSRGWKLHLQVFIHHTPVQKAQDAAGLLYCQGTLPAHMQLAFRQDAQALSRYLSPGFLCSTCLIARGFSFPGAGLSICPCRISRSPSRTLLQLV